MMTASACSCYLGISQTISLLEATDCELKATADLQVFLQEREQIETEEGLDDRNRILTELNVLVQRWVRTVCPQFTEGVRDGKIGQVLAFGGQQLGIVSKSSDIDALCVVPHFVEREDFFKTFLKTLQNEPKANDIKAIEGAIVPIISLKFKNVKVDMCLARLSVETSLPVDWDSTDDTVLDHLDPVSARSLNGVRECLALQQLVPDMETVRLATTAVKHWAKVKGFYGAGFGFPSGIAWTIMIARVCQLYPNATPAVIMQKLFILFANWRWPTPVLLKELPAEQKHLKFETWNPKIRTSDSYHIMPIITPAYPERNVAFAVTRSALKLITKQMETDNGCAKDVISDKLSWSELFTVTTPFLKMYKHFLVVAAQARNEDHLQTWSGLVESRLRTFVNSLDKQQAIDTVHPWYQSSKDKSSSTIHWFLGLQFHKGTQVKLDIGSDIQEFIQSVGNLASERSIFKPGMTINIKHVKRKDLLSEFPTGDILHTEAL